MNAAQVVNQYEAGAPRRRVRRGFPLTPRQTLVAVLVVVVVVGALVVWIHDRCTGTPREHEGSCIGVTDSADFGDPDLAKVMARITAQNREATVGDEYYSIAYLLPLELINRRSSLSTELRNELEGAAVAQAEANRRYEVKIKLLVANTGPDSVHWRPVVADLRSAVTGLHRLRAVAGLGTSLAATKEAIDALTAPPAPKDDDQDRVAAIGSRLTADSLSLDPGRPRIEGFVRVAPTNADEGAAAAALIRESGARRPLLVSDRNAADAYVATLGQAFQATFADAKSQSFNGEQGSQAVAFDSIVLNLCVDQPDAVYFAGRDDGLVEFLRSLARRTCQDVPVAVFTGDDVSDVLEAAAQKDRGVQESLSGNVTVTYTGLASPDLWNDPNLATSFDGVAAKSLQDSQVGLSDGAAIMGHDAVLLGITAIQRVAGLGGKPATASDVMQALYAVNGAASIAGASGRISLNECGNVEEKIFPILRVSPAGTPDFVRPMYTATGGTRC